MKNRIITISREFGSGGRTIANLVAKKLSIPCYDSELINKIAEKSGFTQKYITEHSELSPSSKMLANAFSLRFPFGNITNDDYLYIIQRDVILDLAQKCSCVIVGRCADYILNDIADCLKVFIHASKEYRAKRIVDVYGEKDIAPLKRIEEKDKRRIAYYEFYTNLKWGKAENYHITLNSSVFTIEKCASIIADLY